MTTELATQALTPGTSNVAVRAGIIEMYAVLIVSEMCDFLYNSPGDTTLLGKIP